MSETMNEKPQFSALPLRVTCPETEFSRAFLQGMLNRMSVSFHKYGAIEDVFPDKVNALGCAQLRISQYTATGNTEALIDAANYLMIEFLHPAVENAEFIPTDSDGSPGRVRSDGEVTAEANQTL